MRKILLTLILAVLAVSALTQNASDTYSFQDDMVLVDDIFNLGYSADQKHLVVFQNGVQGSFLIYEGIRGNENRTVRIQDDLKVSVTPISFQFSGDENITNMLLIGSAEGGLYGFTINNGTLQFPHKYEAHFGNITEQLPVTTISISSEQRIIVGASNLLVVLDIPTQGKTFKQVQRLQIPDAKVKSVDWSPIDLNIALVGTVDTKSLFAFYDVVKNQTLKINDKETFSVVFFPDGNKIAQGKLTQNIEIYAYQNGVATSLLNITEIPTINATQLFVDSTGSYMSTQIQGKAQVQAWIITQTSVPSNLHTANNLKAIQAKNSLNSPGTNLASTYNGNQILIVSDGAGSNVAKRFNLCNDGKFLQNSQCVDCTNGCGRCFSPDTCLTCPVTKETYITVQNTCESCALVTSGCKTCQDSGTCATCNTQKNYQEPVTPAGKCLCQVNYYEQGDECITCLPLAHCLLCDYKDHCLRCIEEENFNPQPNLDGKCICNDGFYLDSSGVCQECSIIPGCISCDSADTCKACSTDQTAHFDPILDEGKCKCLKGYGLNGTICQLCNNFVKYCSQCSKDGKECTDCGADQRELVNNTCQCQGHRYEAQDSTCQLCDSPFQKCLYCQQQQPHTCIECDQGKFYQKLPENGVCKCINGYNQQNNICVTCTVLGCFVCQEIEICTQCAKQKRFIPQPQNNVCICQQGSYKTDDGSSCFTCGQAIDGCTDCDNLKECKECDIQGNFHLNDETKICQCDATFFKSGKQCRLCSSKIDKCSQCSFDGSICTKCQSETYPNEDQSKCLTCGERLDGCVKCSDLTKCEECDTGNNFQLNATNLCQCKSTFFKNDNKKCQLCSSKISECQKCNQNGSNCQSCKNSFYLKENTCLLCSQEYDYCQDCDTTQCITCQQNFILNQQKNKCLCPDDRTIDEGKCIQKGGLSALVIIAIIVGILALAGGVVAIIKCYKKRQSPLEDDQYEALEGEK